MDPITARRLRLKHTASAAESAAASLGNHRTNALVLLHPSAIEDTTVADEAFGGALVAELGEIVDRVREIYTDLDHLALADEIDGPAFADCHYRLAHRGAEMPVKEEMVLVPGNFSGQDGWHASRGGLQAAALTKERAVAMIERMEDARAEGRNPDAVPLEEAAAEGAPVISQLRDRMLSDDVVSKALSKGSMADPQLRPVNRAVIVAALETALDAVTEEAAAA